MEKIKNLTEIVLREGVIDLIKRKYNISYSPGSREIRIYDKNINKEGIWDAILGKPKNSIATDHKELYLNLLRIVDSQKARSEFGIPPEVKYDTVKKGAMYGN